MAKLTAISLYSGAGGLDYGFEAAGFRTAVAVEMDAACCATLRLNRRWPILEGDIGTFPTDEILEAAGLRAGEADVLIGGPPCQPFSKSGYWARGDSRRLEDPRASTLQEYMRVLEESRPRAFLLENVPGLAFNGKDEGLRLLLDMLRQINKKTGTRYRASVRQLNAADYGVPQLRQRVFVIGSRDGTEVRFPPPTHRPPEDLAMPSLLPREVEPYRTAWDALADIKANGDESLTMTGKWARLLPSIPEGDNYLYHTDHGSGLPLFGWRRRFWSFLLKLAKDKPSWTIQAQPGPSTGPFHWSNRRLSMRELCRLQTFPDDVVIAGDLRTVQKQVGNAVPSLLAETLAREIRGQLLGSRAHGARRLLPPDRSPIPAPEPVTSVPTEYRHLAGDHDAHPGTGQGYRATSMHADL